MFREEKNLKDSEGKLTTSQNTTTQGLSVNLSYTKTKKLVTALYMVTDIIDKDEPLRNKLRTLGAEIISDIYTSILGTQARIAELMSFLDIAVEINIISKMNYGILQKEFFELAKSIRESMHQTEIFNRSVNLSQFFTDETSNEQGDIYSIGHKNSSIGHHKPTRIGVQSGETLMKALSEKALGISGKNKHIAGKADFEMLKKQRRYEICGILEKNNGSATITDIKNLAYGSLVSCGEKTLQRELVSMVKDGVLNKTGEKRWSKYSLKIRS